MSIQRKILYGRLRHSLRWPMKIISVALNLLFLPEPWRQWMFGTGTRALEGLNALMLLGWAWVMAFADGVLALPSYSRFANLPLSLVCGLFALVGILLAAFLPSETPRSNVISGWLLLAASMLWVLVTASFWGGYPPANTAMVIYPVLALISWWAGILLIENSKHQMEKAQGV